LKEKNERTIELLEFKQRTTEGVSVMYCYLAIYVLNNVLMATPIPRGWCFKVPKLQNSDQNFSMMSTGVNFHITRFKLKGKNKTHKKESNVM